MKSTTTAIIIVIVFLLITLADNIWEKFIASAIN
jgi:hypothetical protein